MARNPKSVSLVQLTTVPLSLEFLRGQPAFMRSRLIDTTVISSPGRGLERFGGAEGVTVVPVAMSREVSPRADLASLVRLLRFLLMKRPVIVHAQTPKAGLLGMLAAWATRRPVRVYSILGLPYVTAVGRRRKLLKWSERVSCTLAHSVICVSESLREVAAEDGLADRSRLRVLAGGSVNGVDTDVRFNPGSHATGRAVLRSERGIEPEATVVGFVGRIVRDKGIEELGSAWIDLRYDFPNAHLVLIGPHEPQDPVSPASMALLRDDPRVHLIGSVDDPAAWYAAMDLVVLPTYREGFPNVPLEAAAMELPVVATLIPGCVDAVVNGVTGTLVPPRDAAALATAMRAYLDGPELRREHGRAGRKRVIEDFQQERIWEAMYQEYCRLLRAKGIPVPEVSDGDRT